MYIAWRKCCRRLLQVSNRTHLNLVHLLCADVDIDVQLHRRQLKFLQNCQSSPNSIVRLYYNLVLNGSKSDVSCSLNSLSSLDKYHLNCYNRIECLRFPVSKTLAGTIKDFIEMRDYTLLPEEFFKRPLRDACLCMGELPAPPAPAAPAAPHFVFLITL